MTIDELLCKFQGLEWHQRSDNTQRYRRPSPCTCGKQYTTVLNLKLHLKAANPDFSDDHTGMELLRWFERERKDMCEAFQRYFPLTAYDFSTFIEWEGKSYMRWVVLLAEWLRLEETREKWGWVECPKVMKWSTDKANIIAHAADCPICGGSGKLPAKWLEERRKG